MTDPTPIQRLCRVQEMDLILDQLHNEESQFPAPLCEARETEATLQQQIQQHTASLESVEKNLKQTRQDLEGLQEQIERTKKEQDQADTKAQIQYGNRLQMLSERAEELEEDIVPLEEKQAELQQALLTLQDSYQAHLPQLQALEAQDQERIAELKARAEETQQERNALVEQLDTRLYKEYSQIRKAKKGQGVAAVKEGRCAVCNVVLPINVQQKVAQNKLPPVKCPSCGRFLVRMSVT